MNVLKCWCYSFTKCELVNVLKCWCYSFTKCELVNVLKCWCYSFTKCELVNVLKCWCYCFTKCELVNVLKCWCYCFTKCELVNVLKCWCSHSILVLRFPSLLFYRWVGKPCSKAATFDCSTFWTRLKHVRSLLMKVHVENLDWFFLSKRHFYCVFLIRGWLCSYEASL